MAESKISSRYASSFLQIAIEKNVLEKTASDMELILKAFESSRELQQAIESPILRSEVKDSVLTEIFFGKVDSETMNFIKFVVYKRRESLLSSIAKRFLELRDEHLGIVRASVLSAFGLSDEQKVQLKKRFESSLSKKVTLSYQIDNNLLGGFVAKVGDTIFDASVKHQLNLLKKHFVKVGITLN